MTATCDICRSEPYTWCDRTSCPSCMTDPGECCSHCPCHSDDTDEDSDHG